MRRRRSQQPQKVNRYQERGIVKSEVPAVQQPADVAAAPEEEANPDAETETTEARQEDDVEPAVTEDAQESTELQTTVKEGSFALYSRSNVPNL